MKRLLARLWSDPNGQDLTEYALLMAFIVLVVIAAVTLFGTTLQTMFNNVAAALAP